MLISPVCGHQQGGPIEGQGVAMCMLAGQTRSSSIQLFHVAGGRLINQVHNPHKG